MPRPAGVAPARSSLLRSAIAGLIALAAVALVGAAKAQTTVIPDEFIAKTTGLSSDELSLVEQYAAQALADLQSPDAATRNRARSRLAGPMSRPSVSVAFRQAYSNVVTPGLRASSSSSDELVIAPAVFIAGRLATQDAWSIIEPALAHESVSVRIAAGGAAQAMMRAVQDSAPALQPAAVSRIVAKLDDAYRAEPNAWVADALARAIGGAGALGRPEFKTVADDAWVRLAVSTGARHKAPPGGEFAAERGRLTTLRVLERLAGREVLAQVAGVDPRVAREAAGLAGIALASVANQAADGSIMARTEMVTLVTIAASVIDQAHLRVGADAPGASELGPLLERADADAEFADRAKRLVLALTRIDVPSERLAGLFD